MPKIREGIEKVEVKNEDNLEMFTKEAIRTTDLYPEVVWQNMADPGWYYRVGKRCWYDRAKHGDDACLRLYRCTC